MLPSTNTETDKGESYQALAKPMGIWLYLILFTLVVAHYLFILLIHSLELMPKGMANQAFFRSNGFYLNFVGNLILAITLIVTLFQMKQSAMTWCLTLFVFDLCSTSYWVLTQNWIEMAGLFGLILVGSIWSACISCYFYLRYLHKQETLIPCTGF